MPFAILRFRPKRNETDLPFEVRPYLRLSGEDPADAVKASAKYFADTFVYVAKAVWRFVRHRRR